MYDLQTYSQAPYTDTNKDGLSYERTSGGYVSYDQDNHVFIINLNIYDAWYDKKTGKMHYDIGTFAHELKHAYQFETGRLSMRANTEGGVTKTGGFLFDYTDEVEAHQRGFDFGSSLPEHPDPKVYSNLPKGERNVNKDNYMLKVNLNKGKKTPLGYEIYKH